LSSIPGGITLQFYDDAGDEGINFCVHVDDVRKELKVTLDKFFEL